MSEPYSTPSVFVAGALLAVGARFTGTIKLYNGRVEFVFDNELGNLHRLERAYREQTGLLVDPKLLFNCLNFMRDALTRALATSIP